MRKGKEKNMIGLSVPGVQKGAKKSVDTVWSDFGPSKVRMGSNKRPRVPKHVYMSLVIEIK